MLHDNEKNILEVVAGRSLTEVWGFYEGDFSILNNYLDYTFRKLRLDGFVFESVSKNFAAFNTGLVTEDYNDLYMCFERNWIPNKQPWYCLGVCTQMDNENPKLSSRLRNACAQMPQRASYFRNLEDVVYDPTRHVACNWDHIVIENVNRLPKRFLARRLFDAPDKIKALVSTSVDLKANDENADDLREFLKKSGDHRNRIRDDLENARKRSSKRCEYCFRLAVPTYYPRLDRVQTLLPLCLDKSLRPDVALLLGRDEQGNYEGRTILTLQMAYNNARLLCKPESSWLGV